VVNGSGYTRWQQFATPQPLATAFDRGLAEQQLLEPAGAGLEPPTQATDTLTAWLHVTNACNLDCPYCYVRKSSQQMDETLGRQALEAIFATARTRQMAKVKLKYAGGEATLHFRLIRRLHALAQQLAADEQRELQAVILSNGVHIKAEDADWCAANGVKLMISVDGVGAVHDRLRATRSGRGSFAAVAHTVDQVLLPRDLHPDITMTVTGVNAGEAAAVARWAIVERGLPLNFNLYRAGLLEKPHNELRLEEETIVAGLREAFALIEQHLPARPFLGSMLDRFNMQAHAHTCGAGQSYVVIGHTGTVDACQMHMGGGPQVTAETDLIPLVAAGPIPVLPVDARTSCASCAIRYRCSGGCPIETYRATGRWDVQSPNCGIFQSLAPDLVKLCGLFLLRKHNLLH
jgi:uncharacterized protein